MTRDPRQDIMDPHIHALDNLEHAHWRVNFIRHLLQAHLASPWKGTREWQARHAEFLHRLATAEDELIICKRAPAILRKIVERPGENSADREPDPDPNPNPAHACQGQRHLRQQEGNPVATKPDSP